MPKPRKTNRKNAAPFQGERKVNHFDRTLEAIGVPKDSMTAETIKNLYSTPALVRRGLRGTRMAGESLKEFGSEFDTFVEYGQDRKAWDPDAYETMEPWSQLPGESNLAYALFREYLRLGPLHRSLFLTAIRAGLIPKNILMLATESRKLRWNTEIGRFLDTGEETDILPLVRSLDKETRKLFLKEKAKHKSSSHGNEVEPTTDQGRTGNPTMIDYFNTRDTADAIEIMQGVRFNLDADGNPILSSDILPKHAKKCQEAGEDKPNIVENCSLYNLLVICSSRYIWASRSKSFDAFVYKHQLELEHEMRMNEMVLVNARRRQSRERWWNIADMIIEKAIKMLASENISAKDFRDIIIPLERTGWIEERAFSGINDILSQQEDNETLPPAVASKLMASLVEIAQNGERVCDNGFIDVESTPVPALPSKK